MAETGSPAPNFTVRDHTGAEVSLESLRGDRVVLWFYPKADTPGCTREGCGFRDFHPDFEAKGVKLFGVSYDPPEENAKFREAYAFPFPLLSDSEREVAKAYGAYDPAQEGYARRNTYVIGPDGTLEHSFEGVDPQSHPKALLDAL